MFCREYRKCRAFRAPRKLIKNYWLYVNKWVKEKKIFLRRKRSPVFFLKVFFIACCLFPIYHFWIVIKLIHHYRYSLTDATRCDAPKRGWSKTESNCDSFDDWFRRRRRLKVFAVENRWNVLAAVIILRQGRSKMLTSCVPPYCHESAKIAQIDLQGILMNACYLTWHSTVTLTYVQCT